MLTSIVWQKTREEGGRLLERWTNSITSSINIGMRFTFPRIAKYPGLVINQNHHSDM